MNKQDIISRLKDFPYSCEEYWVITGSAMVLYGIREQTHDIDMGCTSALADQLVADGNSYQLTEGQYKNDVFRLLQIVDPEEDIATEGLVRESVETFLTEVVPEPVRTEQMGLQITMGEALEILRSKYL